MTKEANNDLPNPLSDFLGGLNDAEDSAAPTGKGKKADLKTRSGLEAAFKAGKLSEDMLDPWNEDHHEWINKLREEEAKKPVWIKPAPNDLEFSGPELYIGVNGKDYYLPVNRWCKVPSFVHMQLQNCQKVKQIQEDDRKHTGKFIAEFASERFQYQLSTVVPKLSGKDKPVVEFC
jgi:hypothetical protein